MASESFLDVLSVFCLCSKKSLIKNTCFTQLSEKKGDLEFLESNNTFLCGLNFLTLNFHEDLTGNFI